MNDDQLIASQARTIAENDVTIADLKHRLDTITRIIVCIGGPLNDNKLGYTNKQLGNFVLILSQSDLT